MGLATLLMSNQQVITGRYDLPFQFRKFRFCANYCVRGILSRFSAFGCLSCRIATRRFWGNYSPSGRQSRSCSRWDGPQAQGYQGNLWANRELTAYVDAVRDSEIDRTTPMVCKNTFIADTLASRLGWRPNYVLSRDLTFDRLIDRLEGPGSVPSQRAEFQPRLFESMALRGITVEEFDKGFGAVVDPADPDWQSRLEMGGFLYNPADFWEPLTHGRSLRRDWLADERPKLAEQDGEHSRSEAWPHNARRGSWPLDDGGDATISKVIQDPPAGWVNREISVACRSELS